MLYELPISAAAFERLARMESQSTGYAFFKLHNQLPETLFVMAHGSIDGRVQVGHLITTGELLKMLIDKKGIIDKGIKEVITISCHGGAQPVVTIDGVTISSMHSSLDEVHAKVMSTIDDEYFLTVSVNETPQGGIAMNFKTEPMTDSQRGYEEPGANQINDELEDYLDDLKDQDSSENRMGYPCDNGPCPFAIEPTSAMCRQCEFDREFDADIERIEAEIKSEFESSINCGELDALIIGIEPKATVEHGDFSFELNLTTKEESPMTKKDLRNKMKALDARFVMSNTSFKQIKRDLLEELLVQCPNILSFMKDELVGPTFESYVYMAVQGNVFPLVDCQIVELGASEASASEGTGLATVPEEGTGLVTVPDASEASLTVEKCVEVELRAGIKDGLLGLYLNKVLVPGVADLSYAQKQIDKMIAENEALKLRVAELEAKHVVNVKPVKVEPTVVETPVRTGRQPKFTAEEFAAMKAAAIAGSAVVVASPTVKDHKEHTGPYTKEEIEALRAQSKAPHFTDTLCQCGAHVTKANLAFVMRPKVQALVADAYKGKALCWHCQQSVLVGGEAFTPEQRKAGVHKSVAQAHISIK